MGALCWGTSKYWVSDLGARQAPVPTHENRKSPTGALWCKLHTRCELHPREGAQRLFRAQLIPSRILTPFPFPLAVLIRVPSYTPRSCIPVMVHDGVEPSWSSLLDTESYSVRVLQASQCVRHVQCSLLH